MKLENVKEKRVFIKLDKKRELVFDLNALATLEKKYKKDFFATIEEFQDKNSVVALKALLYCSLKHEDKKLTLKQTGKLVKLINLTKVKQKVIEAINASMVDPEDAIKESESTASLGPAGKKF
jgi:hypothetical protein